MQYPHQVVETCLREMFSFKDNGSIDVKVADALLFSNTIEGVTDYYVGDLNSIRKSNVKRLAPECYTKSLWTTTASDFRSFDVLMWEVFSNGKESYYSPDISAEEKTSANGIKRFTCTEDHLNRLEGCPQEYWQVTYKTFNFDDEDRINTVEIELKLNTIYQLMHFDLFRN